MKRGREEDGPDDTAKQISEMKVNLDQVISKYSGPPTYHHPQTLPHKVEALLALDPANADVMVLKQQLTEAIALLAPGKQEEVLFTQYTAP